MKGINVYLTFDGNCKEAMTFYHKCLGGDLQVHPFSQGPADMAKGAGDRLMHASVTSGTSVVMASDSMPGMPVTAGNNFSISVQCETDEEADRLFGSLSEGGTAVMPMADQFWGAYFGMLTDKFGINWMFNCEKAGAGAA